MIKAFGISLLAFVVLDFLWLGFVVKKFNLQQLAEIGRIENGDFSLLYLPAGLAYVFMAALVTFFVLPKIAADASWLSVFGWGALMGLLVYGVFDMTNLAILKNYPIPFLVADMAWGTFVFAIVSVITWKLSAS
jgi:uncharacterized membrane protein